MTYQMNRWAFIGLAAELLKKGFITNKQFTSLINDLNSRKFVECLVCRAWGSLQVWLTLEDGYEMHARFASW